MGIQIRDLFHKLRNGEYSKKLIESDNLTNEVSSDGLNSPELAKLLCKLFKKYREPSKGAFHFPTKKQMNPKLKWLNHLNLCQGL